PGPVRPPLRLRVVTFNIHGGRPARGPGNLEGTARALRELDPDVVGLQEVYRWAPLPGAFQDQPARLARLLSLHITFRASVRLGPCAYGNALLSRWPLQRVRHLRLPATGSRADL